MGFASVCLKVLTAFSIATPAAGQWSSIVSNQDGTQIYFVSRIQQSGTAQPAYGKLFIADSSGVRPLLIRNRDVTEYYFPGSVAYRTNAFDIIGADIAADISRLNVVALYECQILSACNGFDFATTTVYDATGQGADFEGRARLSPDGQWLSLITYATRFFPLGAISASVSNLKTGKVTSFNFPDHNADYKNGAIANSGEFAFGGGDKGLTLAIEGAPIRSVADEADFTRLDASGNTLIWAQTVSGSAVIMAANSPAFTPRVLFSSLTDSSTPSISSDGTKAVFLTGDAANRQAFLIGTDGTGLTQITRETAGVTDAMLTGDGRTVVAVGGDGSLLRFKISDGSREQLIGPTLSLTSGSFPGGVGQLVHITGTHLDSATVRLNGLPVPVLRSAINSLDFQVPWDADASASLSVQPATSLSGWMDAAQFSLTANGLFVAAAHQDFSTLVTPAQPAHPGEIVNLYAIGLGPVANPPVLGQPAPNSPLSLLVTPLKLVINGPEGNQLVPEVLFAGLAPGTLGYYQVSIRLPTALTNGTWSLQSPTIGQGYLLPIAQ